MTPNTSLLQWLATFQLDGQPAIEYKKDAFYNLADGYICAKILNQIVPLYFTDKWLEGIRPVAPNGSWRLRVSNLKRILQKINDYDSDLSNSQFRLSAITPDVTVIAQNFDPDQISRLIQLILFCAISCDKKQDYIAKIRDLPTQVKQDIKEAIEEILVRNDDSQNKLNTSQLSTDSTYGDIDTRNNSYNKLNLSSTSRNVPASPARIPAPSTGYSRDPSQIETTNNSKFENTLDTSSQSYYSNVNDTVDEIRQKLFEALIVKDEQAQTCHELQLRVKQLQLERDQLAHDNERLLCEINAAPVAKSSDSRRQSHTNRDLGNPSANHTMENDPVGPPDGKSNDLILVQNRRMQNEIQQLKEELIRTETEKDDYRLKSNLLKEDLDKITTKHEELRTRAEQVKRLQDELDEHKQMAEKIISYETMVENLVKKNSDIKKEVKNLEEKNLSHVQNIVKLEQENQHLLTSISQIEIYRRQLNDLQAKLSEETHRADQAEVESARLLDKMNATKKENEKLFEATNQLMRRNSNHDIINELGTLNKNFESVNLKEGLNQAKVDYQSPHDDDIKSISMPMIDLKERIARLEAEKQILEAKANSQVESNKTVLGGLLDEATNKCKLLENDNRQMRKKLMILEANIKELTQSSGGQPSTSNAILVQDSSSDNTLSLIKRVEDLQRLLYQREQELRDAEIRYKRNIQKAKEVMKSLNNNQSISGSLHPSCTSSASFNSNSLDEMNILRQQLQDRENRLIELEREFFEFKKMKEVHERLILSAFYGLTTPMQWKNAEKRIERTSITSTPNTASSSINSNRNKHSH